jgi:hypothetical protein
VNKRISFLGLFAVGTLLLGLIGVISAMAAPAAATADGTIALDESWYTTSGNIKITVTDADLNSAVATTTDVLVSTGSTGAAVASLATSNYDLGSNVVGTPAVYASSSNRTAGTPKLASVGVEVIDAVNGLVRISNATGAELAAGTTLYWDFKVSEKDTVKIKLTSTQDSTSFIPAATQVVLTETSIDSGKFEVLVALNTTGSVTGSSPALKVLNGDTITVTYTDAVNKAGATTVKVTDTAKVETNATLISNIVPTHEAATQLQLPVFTAVINDSDSGVDIGNIYILLDRDDSGLITYDSATRRLKISGTDNTALLPYFTKATADKVKLKAEVDAVGNTEIVKPTVTGTGAAGSDVSVTFTPATVLGSEGAESDIAWAIIAFDKAGNATMSDSNSASTSATGKPQLENIDEPHLVRVDRLAPSFGTGDVLTGKYWDADTAAVKDNKKTSIEIKFSEKLDAASVVPGDFTVDGITPAGAEVQSKLETSVFLTLAADMLPDAKPKVALVAAIADKAGNTKTSIAAITGSDKIAPTFTVSADKTLTNKGIVITITSNEAVSGNLPTVNLYKKGVDTAVEKAMPVVVTATNTWKSEVTTSLNVANEVMSIYVEGRDLSQNIGVKGKKDSSVVGAITFTYDTTVAAPTFDPLKSSTSTLTPVHNSAPFLRAIYAEKVTMEKAEFGVKGATLTDVKAKMFTSDSKTWIYSSSALVVGTDYEIKLDAKDLAGNDEKASQTEFTVKERAVVKITLVPGQNLISIPGAPADSAINNVGLPAEADSVITYDPAAADGPWLVATRPAGGGDFSGTLTTLDSSHAYWVGSTSTAPLEVDIPAQSHQATLPAIPVKAGWNMVPVVSLNTDALPATISADIYFNSVNWVTAYSYDTTTTTWSKVQPKQVPVDTVAPKKGYWLYVAADGTLVP